MLDLLPAGACLCDADGRITHYSAHAATLWGRAPDLRAGPPPRYSGAVRLFDERGAPLPHAHAPAARALRDGRPQHGRAYQIERADGERRHVVGYATPLLDDAGEVTGVLDLAVDVTERHRAAQAERERLQARGEELVSLACDIRAGLTPLRRAAGPSSTLDAPLRRITELVDRVLNLEVDVD